MPEVSLIELVATCCFAVAILHTFSVKQFQHLAHRYPEGSVGENLFHLLGEIEVVFGLWAGVFVLFLAAASGLNDAVHYVERLNFTEPAFVFVILTVCSTKPILQAAFALLRGCAKLLPLPAPVAFYAVALTVGPLLGSFITEPAAMTVTALVLLQRFYKVGISQKLMYATLGLLFVNVSIGGTLTPYAAPPVLMVAGIWGWDLGYMMANFGYKGALACVLSAGLVTALFFKELKAVPWRETSSRGVDIPYWVSAIHLLFLAVIVVSAHHMVIFLGFFLFFLGLVNVTREYQDKLNLREGLLVAFFLGGLVVLGQPQQWWLQPLLSRLDAEALFMGAIGLTAITDNAALTYLGAQVQGLSEMSKYALVAGAVVGGGLTVIANAPNPAGYGILNDSFGKEGISPISLFLAALPPTAIAATCFWLLS